MEPFVLILLAIGLSLMMAIAWAIQRLTKHSGWIDVIWSLAVGLGGIAAVALPSETAQAPRLIAVGVLVLAWSGRLAWHIAARTHGGEDDPRYAKLMKEWGKNASLMLFLFLQVQALAAFVLVLSIRLAATHPLPFPRLLDSLGLGLVITAIVGEAIADAQLKQFSRQHKGDRKAVCDTGLWALSRHPNYFFEWLGWVGWAVVAINLSGPAPLSLLALGAPLLMYWLLVHVSGIPPLEQHMLATRGDAFRKYQARVNAFFPGPGRDPAKEN